MGTIWLDGRTPGYPPIDQVIRDAGLELLLYDGWQNRSRSSGGIDVLQTVVVHHTASSTSFQNDWNYCVNAEDGPVANLLLGREGQVGLHSGGASNHAGKGGPWNTSRGVVPLDSCNSRSIGIEASNAGTGEAWPEVQVDAYERLVAALVSAYGLVPPDVVAHREWAPGRKIDPWGGNVPTPGAPYTGAREWVMRGGAGFIDAVADRLEGEDMANAIVQLIAPSVPGYPNANRWFVRWASGHLSWASNADTTLAASMGVAVTTVEMGLEQYNGLCDQAGVEGLPF